MNANSYNGGSCYQGSYRGYGYGLGRGHEKGCGQGREFNNRSHCNSGKYFCTYENYMNSSTACETHANGHQESATFEKTMGSSTHDFF